MDVPAQILSLSDGISPDEAAAAVSRAGTVVLGVPLYVDGLPSPAIRLMEAVKEKYSGDPCRIYAVVNNGLYESRQNDNLLEMIKAWCSDCGFIYSGALAIGAGEVVGTLMRGQSMRSGLPGMLSAAFWPWPKLSREVKKTEMTMPTPSCSRDGFIS